MKRNTMRRFASISFAAYMLLSSACAPANEVDYMESFDSAGGSLPHGWKAVSGNFSVKNDGLFTDASKGFSLITFGKPSWQNYEIEVTATFLAVENKSRWLAVVFRSGADGKIPRSQYTLRYQCNKSNGAEFAVYSKASADDKPGWSIRKKAKVKQNFKLNITQFFNRSI